MVAGNSSAVQLRCRKSNNCCTGDKIVFETSAKVACRVKSALCIALCFVSAAVEWPGNCRKGFAVAPRNPSWDALVIQPTVRWAWGGLFVFDHHLRERHTMLVDNSPFSPSYFAPPGGDYPELNDIFDTDLFNNSFAQSAGSSASPADSRGSSPHALMTPPQDPGPTSFPDVHDEEDQASQSHPFFSMYAGDIKPIDDGTSPDFMGLGPIDGAFATEISPYAFSYSPPSAFDPMDLGVGTSEVDSTQLRGINPQLVDTPSAISDHGDDDTEDIKPVNPPVVEKKETERLTVTIAPSKVGSAKSRKGAVQSGGVAKKTALSSIAKEKENAIAALAAKRPASTRAAKASTPASTSSAASPMFLTGGDSVYAFSDAGDEDDDDDHDSLRGDRRVDFKDDLPHDWRPPPEVLAKMSSKEKRQLRNKISARNFRVRRKGTVFSLVLFLISDKWIY